MRTPPVRKPDLETLRAQAQTAFAEDTLSLEVELITPLFGGGVIPKKVDEVCWLRASEVKAGLRFWWRALYGHRYATSKELHEEEAKRFGSAKGNEGLASPVAVRVILNTAPKALNADSITDVRKSAYYPNEGEVLPAGATAKLMLRFPSDDWDFRDEVKKSLACWVLFGGVGARSRRGAGAIAPRTRQDALEMGYPIQFEDLGNMLPELFQGVALRQYFSITNGARILAQQTGGVKPEESHQTLMAHWRAFRQCRVHPPNWMGKEGWGLSCWPEPDHVRFRRKSQGGEPRHNQQMADTNRGKAPRLLLGAPIVLHWMQGPKAEKIQDAEFGLSFPDDGNSRIRRFVDRYASPILITVARFWNNGKEEHRGMVLVTQAAFHLAGGAPCLKEAPNEVLAVNDFRPLQKRGAGYAVSDPADMVDQVIQAFSTPKDDTIRPPHFFEIKNA